MTPKRSLGAPKEKVYCAKHLNKPQGRPEHPQLQGSKVIPLTHLF